MTRIQVQAGQSVLEGYVKKPGVGLCELVWNAFDEDATNVRISIEANDLGRIERVMVADDGIGMNAERVSPCPSRRSATAVINAAAYRDRYGIEDRTLLGPKPATDSQRLDRARALASLRCAEPEAAVATRSDLVATMRL